MVKRLVAIATMLGAFWWPPSYSAHPGSQNHASPTSFFVCGYTKGSLTTVQHSSPSYFDQYHIRYTCIGHRHDPGVVCVWTAIQWAGGQITGPYNQSCAPF